MIRQLQRLGARAWTGSVACSVPDVDEPARAFLYRGGIYAAQIPGYRPRVRARLASAGVLDATREAIVDRSLGDGADDLAVGRFAVSQGWLGAERLGAIHGEYVLASLGAIGEYRATAEQEGHTTEEFCTLPSVVSEVVDALEVRRRRQEQVWGYSMAPEAARVHLASVDTQPGHQMPEVLAFLAACAVPTTIDQAAWECGFTRAEAAYLAASLAQEGVVGLTPGAAVPGSWVPEVASRS